MDTRLLTYRNVIRFFTKGDTPTLVKEYNDLFCLFLSQIVYFSDSFILKHLKELGCERVELVDYNGPTAVCLELNGTNYVSIKGLSGRNKSEWPIILNFIAKKFDCTRAHGGFVIAAERLIPHVDEFLSHNDFPVILTGHSMGGAIATLTSLGVSGCKVTTFGSPKTVVKDELDAFDGTALTHYRIDTDFVTLLPPFIYKRPGKQITEHKKWPLRFWDNHKLYTYSSFLMPVLADKAAMCRLHLD